MIVTPEPLWPPDIRDAVCEHRRQTARLVRDLDGLREALVAAGIEDVTSDPNDAIGAWLDCLRAADLDLGRLVADLDARGSVRRPAPGVPPTPHPAIRALLVDHGVAS